MRSRFLYKDLIDLRKAGWKARREEETAKTLDEIKKDFEREERVAAQQAQQMNRGYRGGGGGGGRDNRSDRDRGGNMNRGDHRGGRRNDRDDGDYRGNNNNRGFGGTPRQRKEREVKVDKDGFVEVATTKGSGGGGSRFGGPGPKILSRSDSGKRESKSNKSFSSRTASVAPPPPVAVSEPLSEDKLKQKAKTLRTEYMEDPNEEDVLLTFDECKGTPKAGHVIVQVSVDAALECKDKERAAIISIISILFRKGKLTSDDIGLPFADIIEFIDSFVVDCPRAMEYLGDMAAEFFHIKALDVAWLCGQAKKLEEYSGHLIPNVIENCAKSLVKSYGVDEAKTLFGAANSALVGLLGSERWNELAGKTGLN